MNGSNSRRFDSQPETAADGRFFDLRESGYTGWIGPDGNKSPCPACQSSACTASITEPCNG